MKNSANTCFIQSPCKINLHLKIKGIRQDGFHDLESLFVCLAFADTLKFELTAKKGFWELLAEKSTVCDDFPGENNLITRAAVLFREKTGFSQ